MNLMKSGCREENTPRCECSDNPEYRDGLADISNCRT